MEDTPVVRQVITRQNGKRQKPRRSPARNGLDQKAQCGTGGMWMGKIMHDVRIIAPQRARSVNAATLFRDRHRNDPGGSLRHLTQQSSRIFRGHQHPTNRTDNLQSLDLGSQRKCIEPVLRA